MESRGLLPSFRKHYDVPYIVMEIHGRGLSDELLIHEPWITMILENPGKSSFFMIGKALFLKQVDIITKKPSYESLQ